MIKNIFKKNNYITVSQEPLKMAKASEDIRPSIPNGMWIKCDKCGETLYKKDLQTNGKVCNFCGYHFRLTAKERIETIVDSETFVEINKELQTVNPLDFEGYSEKIQGLKIKTGMNEAIVTGYGKIAGFSAVIAVMDSNFMMGSMGSVVGEKITRAIEKAMEMNCPLVIFTASGGARMQEGMFSLMQMAKTSAAIEKLNEKGILYVSVLTDPTTGGVTASFASLGDIILAEPGALIGFAGRRVIEQTIRQKLPDEFQRAEFLLEHGFVDKIVQRKELKKTLKDILLVHSV